MSLYENVRNISAVTNVVASVAAATMFRFVTWKNNAGRWECENHVPAATGAAARGICAMKPDAKNVVDGLAVTLIALPDGGQCLVELGEAVVDLTVPLRIGGNAAEIDGAAYLANAAGDVIVAYPLQLGAVGDIIEIQFVGYAGLIP